MIIIDMDFMITVYFLLFTCIVRINMIIYYGNSILYPGYALHKEAQNNRSIDQ